MFKLAKIWNPNDCSMTSSNADERTAKLNKSHKLRARRSNDRDLESGDLDSDDLEPGDLF